MFQGQNSSIHVLRSCWKCVGAVSPRAGRGQRRSHPFSTGVCLALSSNLVRPSVPYQRRATVVLRPLHLSSERSWRNGLSHLQGAQGAGVAPCSPRGGCSLPTLYFGSSLIIWDKWPGEVESINPYPLYSIHRGSLKSAYDRLLGRKVIKKWRAFFWYRDTCTYALLHVFIARNYLYLYLFLKRDY